MTRLRKKGFTLIELIGVLVIMAILALIVTPLVLNIIRKARTAADKRSIDAYGRSIELAIASYLLDNGKFPTSVNQLTVEYSGNQVVCSTTQLNPDSSVYLTGCTVGGRSVGDYAYGKYETPTYTSYAVGDEVTYNNVNYYVIKDSGVKKPTVTLLKAEPLTADEVNLYGGVGTENNHVNENVEPSLTKGTAANYNGYGGMQYYGINSQEEGVCGHNGYTWADNGGCTNDYEKSHIKYVVDAWSQNQVPSGLIEARLITKVEYEAYCLSEDYQETPSDVSTRYVPQYDWLYNSNYYYWTMTPYNDSTSSVWVITYYGDISHSIVYTYKTSYNPSVKYSYAVRPVIVLDKSVLN